MSSDFEKHEEGFGRLDKDFCIKLWEDYFQNPELVSDVEKLASYGSKVQLANASESKS
jgi:hypothetical protein